MKLGTKILGLAGLGFMFIGTAWETKAAGHKITTRDKELYEACVDGKIDDAKKAVDAGADINARLLPEEKYTYEYPLHAAVYGGHTDIVEYLVKRIEIKLDKQDSLGNTALMSALINKNTEIAKLFIDADAKLNLKNNQNRTALIIAVIDGNEEIVKLLLKKKLADKDIDIDAQDEDDNTALMSALIGKYSNIAQLLIEAGADLTKVNKKGKNAYDLAAYDQDLQKMIKEKAKNGLIEEEKRFDNIAADFIKLSDINTIKTFIETFKNFGSKVEAYFRQKYADEQLIQAYAKKQNEFKIKELDEDLTTEQLIHKIANDFKIALTTAIKNEFEINPIIEKYTKELTDMLTTEITAVRTGVKKTKPTAVDKFAQAMHVLTGPQPLTKKPVEEVGIPSSFFN